MKECTVLRSPELPPLHISAPLLPSPLPPTLFCCQIYTFVRFIHTFLRRTSFLVYSLLASLLRSTAFAQLSTPKPAATNLNIPSLLATCAFWGSSGPEQIPLTPTFLPTTVLPMPFPPTFSSTPFPPTIFYSTSFPRHIANKHQSL